MRAPPYSKQPDELFATATIEDPQPLFARLRSEHPISRVDETGVHLVATWDLIDEVLHRERDFSANLTGVLTCDESGLPGTFSIPGADANQVIATADEPEHTVHRALVQPRLSPRRTAELERSLSPWVEQVLTPWLAQAGGDFIPIAELIPARAIAQVLGLPDGDVGRHRAWAMMAGDLLAGRVSHQQVGVLGREIGRMVEYLGEHLDVSAAAVAGDPKPPLLNALAGGVARTEVDRGKALGIAMVMFGAGGESTAALIGSVVRRLAEDQEMADELRKQPALIPRFIEEVVRLETPFKFHYRAVFRDCELGGFDLFEGDRLMLLWASANRDPAYFDDPNVLRLDRRHPKQHMSFGRGGHFCVGAAMARLEARVVLEQLLSRSKRVSLCADDRPVHTPSIFVRRLERLPIEVEAV